jgi:hypothetical protein
MTRPDDRNLEDRLRRALRAEAERHQPRGDGLMLIRERVGARSRRWAWMRPALALAGSAAVVGAVLAAPTVFTGIQRDVTVVNAGGSQVPLSEQATGSGSPTPPTESAPSPAGSGSPSPSDTGSPSPSDPRATSAAPSEAPLQDRVTVWPYPSRFDGRLKADADVESGRFPQLRDPAQTAVDFVESFVGEQELFATSLGPFDPGIRMLVQRRLEDGTPEPVSTVFLIRVRYGDDAPYVVAGASREAIDTLASMSIFKVPSVVDTDPLPVQGNVRRPGESPDPTVHVQLRLPGVDEVLAQDTAEITAGPPPLRHWSATLTPLTTLPSTGVVAAWTLDDAGKVVEFVATPTG